MNPNPPRKPHFHRYREMSGISRNEWDIDIPLYKTRGKGLDKTYTKYFARKREPETKKLEDIPLTFL